jgi:hypothetical protein
VIRSEFYRWAGVQRRLDRLYHPGPGSTSLPVSAEWNDFIQVRELMRPIYSEEGNRVYAVSGGDLNRLGIRHGFANLSRMNLLRSVAGLIFRGYAEESQARWIWEAGIKEAEMQKFFEDFRELAIDVGLVDQRTFNAGNRTFVEGNLFTYQSNGLRPGESGPANELSATETMALFAFLYSGGDISNRVREHLGEVCEHGPVDLQGHDKLARACVLEHLTATMTGEIGNLPGLQAYLRGLSLTDQAEFARTLLHTAYSPENSDPDWVEGCEFSTMSMILHYMETLMTRFDANGDGIANKSELEGAIPLFVGYIIKMADEKLDIHGMSDRRARAALLFILDAKRVPESWTDFATVLRIENLWEPDLALDRLQLAHVFEAIGQRLITTGVKETPKSPMLAPDELSSVTQALALCESGHPPSTIAPLCATATNWKFDLNW